MEKVQPEKLIESDMKENSGQTTGETIWRQRCAA